MNAPNQTLRDNIKQSIQDYRKARVTRREAFGPDLLDTVIAIGQATAEASKATVQKLWTPPKGKDPFLTSVQTGIASTRDTAKQWMTQMQDTSKHWQAGVTQAVKNKIQHYREGAAEKLEALAATLKGPQAATSSSQTSPKQTPRKENPMPTNTSKPQTKSHEDLQGMDAIDPQSLLEDFAKTYYYQTGQHPQMIQEVDRKKNPTYKDYVFAAGMSELVDFWLSKGAESPSKGQENGSKKQAPAHIRGKYPQAQDIQAAVRDVNTIRRAQTQIKGLESQINGLKDAQLRLRNQVIDLANKYGIDTSDLGVGRSEMAAKSDEEQEQRLSPQFQARQAAEDIDQEVQQTAEDISQEEVAAHQEMDQEALEAMHEEALEALIAADEIPPLTEEECQLPPAYEKASPLAFDRHL